MVQPRPYHPFERQQHISQRPWIGPLWPPRGLPAPGRYQCELQLLLLSVTQAYISSSNGNSDTRHELNDLRFGTPTAGVRAYVNGDTSARSTPWTFTTRDFVNLTTPSDGSSTWTACMDWLRTAVLLRCSWIPR